MPTVAPCRSSRPQQPLGMPRPPLPSHRSLALGQPRAADISATARSAVVSVSTSGVWPTGIPGARPRPDRCCRSPPPWSGCAEARGRVEQLGVDPVGEHPAQTGSTPSCSTRPRASARSRPWPWGPTTSIWTRPSAGDTGRPHPRRAHRHHRRPRGGADGGWRRRRLPEDDGGGASGGVGAVDPRRRWARPARRTVGIVGLGGSRQAFARASTGFGVTLLDARRDGLDRLLADSDFVTLHCPLTDDTRGLIGADALRRMKSDATLVNTARGPIVDQDALARRAARGRDRRSRPRRDRPRAAARRPPSPTGAEPDRRASRGVGDARDARGDGRPGRRQPGGGVARRADAVGGYSPMTLMTRRFGRRPSNSV